MDVSETKARLDTICPRFASFWDLPDNCSREEDGSFTVCGLFIEFTHFFRDEYLTLSESQLSELGEFVEESMGVPHSSLDEAVATCFLENIAGEPCAIALDAHLGKRAKKFISYWSSGAA